MQKSTLGLLQLAAAAIAWDQVAPVFRAGTGVPLLPARPGARAHSTTVLVAQDIVFRYRDKGPALLRGVDLQVHRGERILLEGPSGSGKLFAREPRLPRSERPRCGARTRKGSPCQAPATDGTRSISNGSIS